LARAALADAALADVLLGRRTLAGRADLVAGGGGATTLFNRAASDAAVFGSMRGFSGTEKWMPRVLPHSVGPGFAGGIAA
jgi:hypothetical protein